MRLKIALQKSGRMGKESLELLERCGLSIVRSDRNLFLRIPEIPIDLLLVRNDDIIGFLEEKVCDLAIIGEDVFVEAKEATLEKQSTDLEIIQRLGFAKCSLCLAVPENSIYRCVQDLQGARIASSYPKMTASFLNQYEVECELVRMEGSVEVAPRLGIADGISDLVSTGATLAANGMRVLEKIMSSEALLIGATKRLSATQIAILEKLKVRIQGVIEAKKSKYIMLHAPADSLEAIKNSLPGAKSPTILPLANEKNIFAVHAVCDEEIFWETMEKLKSFGASAILVLPIEKMMT